MNGIDYGDSEMYSWRSSPKDVRVHSYGDSCITWGTRAFLNEYVHSRMYTCIPL